jgi:nucleotide-binding universal stress UspA family protein
MKPFRTVLFAADFSENSKEAFSVACSLAREDKTRLFVLTVADPDWVGEETLFFVQGSEQYYKKACDEERRNMLEDKLRNEYLPAQPIDVEYGVRRGEITDEIIATASEIGADLIVMGTHGRTGMSWMISGSVATAVLRKAPCSVLALRSSVHMRNKEEGARVILHPTDFSESSRAALEVARSLARDHGARLVILHVTAPAILMDGTVAGEIDPSTLRAALEDLRARLDGPDLKFPIETRLVLGSDREEILRTAEEIGVDMIVMGTHGRTALGRLLMGSVAESVLPRAACPVMVVKAVEHAGTRRVEKAVSNKTVHVY